MSGVIAPATTSASRWSYRLKVPLALSAVALAAGVAIATMTYLLVFEYVEANATAQMQRLARTLARSLVQPVLSNDVWQAYNTVRASSLSRPSDPVSAIQVLVVDAQGAVFAALDPQAFPVGTNASLLTPSLAAAARWISDGRAGVTSYRSEDDEAKMVVVAERLIGEEQSLLGGIIVQQEQGIPRAQARAVAERLTLLGSLVIACIAAVGWIVGRRMTGPLEKLRRSMQAAPSEDVRPAVAEVSRLNDEVGDLGTAFLGMMAELDAKRQLERDMLNAERMASIGRLTAGIAHEVNNPLGGMLNAIDNRRIRGGVDGATERTLGLLERGLQQIHSTVNALLNEARRELHELREDDLHDLFLLVHPEAVSAQCALEWELAVPTAGTLPSVSVRQVILNLTLNALSASGSGGRVRVESVEQPGRWSMKVSNSGSALGAEALTHLLQGHTTGDDRRTGLGLWITARILHTLGGSIELLDRGTDPVFATTLVATFPIHSTERPE
jgi:signal transduction histidine kinase